MSSYAPDERDLGDAPVITADQFERAFVKSGRTAAEVAEMLGVTRNMVYTYRAQGVSKPARRVERVRRVMGLWMRDEDDRPLLGYTDDDLVNELQRRLRRVQDLLSRTDDEEPSDVGTTSDLPSDGETGGRYTGSGGPA